MSDFPVNANTLSGVRPVTRYNHAKVCENCPHPNPFPFIVPVLSIHPSFIGSSKSHLTEKGVWKRDGGREKNK